MVAAESQGNSGGRGLWRLSGPATFSGRPHLKFTPGTEFIKKQFLAVAVQTRWLKNTRKAMLYPKHSIWLKVGKNPL